MPFEPGQSGNPSGTKTERKFLAALLRAIAQDNSARLRQAAEKLLDFAASGEAWAIKELADRLDGRAPQAIQAQDADGRDLAIALIAYNPSQLPTPALPAPDTEISGLRH
jgi:hypothetical protein